MPRGQEKQKYPRVSAIIVAWKSADCIGRCIESLQASVVPLDIIVIDNDSPDDVKGAVAKYPEVTYKNSGDNIGYAAGNNLGLKIAEKSNANYFFILNPDAYIDKNCVKNLLDVLQKDPGLGMACPKTYYADSDTIWFAGATLDMKTGTSPHIGQGQKDGPAFSKDHDLPRANGCAMLLSKEALRKVGHMEEKYFLYFEEIDWSLRFEQAGYRMRFVAEAHVWHAASTSSGGFFTPLYQYYTTRNSLDLVRRFGEGSWAVFAIKHVGQSFKRLINVAQNRPKMVPAVVSAIALGYLDYMRGRFGRHDF
jgi:GT2 family glycosyltransferase